MHSQLKKPVCPFISSTFKDFQEERDYLVKHTFPELQQICKDKYTYFAPIDLRWGINKNQSQAGRVISLCFDYIQTGSPYFICLLGDRYGYHYDEETGDQSSKDWFWKNLEVAMKEGHTWVQQHRDKSITELEIIAALEHANCTRCFFYFRDQNFVKKKFPNPTEEERVTYFVENEKCARKLATLKEKIAATQKVSHFSSPKELGDLILEDLKNSISLDYGDTESMVLLPHLPQQFTERIHSLPPDKREMILAHHLFEARCGDAVRIASFGEDVIEKLNEHAYSIGQSNHKPILLLTGQQGCGKSTILARWALQYKSDVPLITHYISCSTYSRDLAHTLENILLILGVDADGSTGGCGSANLECTSKQWSTMQDNIEHFNRVVQEQKFVLAIDCLEALSADSDHAHVIEDFTWLPSSIPANVRIILTFTAHSQQHHDFLEKYKFKGEKNIVEYTMSGINNVEDRKMVVRKHLETYCKHLDSQQLEKICNTNLSYNPMYLVAVANELRVFGIYDEVDSQINEIVEAPTQEKLWYNIFIRWCRDYGWSDCAIVNKTDEPFGWVQDALCFIAMSRRGLTESEILGALYLIGYRDCSEVKTADWASFYRAAQDSLIKEHTGMFSLAHGCVQKAVLCSVMGGSDQVNITPRGGRKSIKFKIARMPSFFRRSHNCYHIKLAYYFQDQPTNWRVLEELPWHWSQAHDWQKLHGIVRTPEYFQLFRSSSELNQFNTFKIDLFRYWDELKENAPHLPQPAETYNNMVRNEITTALAAENYTVEKETSMEELVRLATYHVTPSEKIKLAKSSWLAGQFLGEICDYEPGTQLLQHAKKLCPGKQSDLLYQINYSLGKVYYYQRDWELARGSFIEALKELKKSSISLNDKLEEECALHNNTVSCLIIMKRLDEAEKILVEAKNKFTALTNYLKSPGYYMYRFNNSRLLSKRANKIHESSREKAEQKHALFCEAISIFEETLEFRMKHYGWRHPLVALNWQENGFLFHHMGNRKQAEICFKEALKIFEEVLSHDHVLIATCYYHLGMIHEEEASWREGIRCFEIALRIRQSKFNHRRSTWADIERRFIKCQAKLQRQNENRSNSAPPPKTFPMSPPESPHLSRVLHVQAEQSGSPAAHVHSTNLLVPGEGGPETVTRRLDRIISPYQRYSLFDTPSAAVQTEFT